MSIGGLIQRFQRVRKEYGFVGSLRHFILQKSPFHVSYFYSVDTPVNLCSVEGLSIECFSQRHSVRPQIIETLRQTRGEAMIREVEKLYARGNELWLGWFQGNLAGFCWTAHGRDKNDYFVPLGKKDGTISSCFVFPEFRGRGIYPFMLQTLVNTLLEKEQLRRIYIDCKSWNYPSIRGIQKAGFGRLGTAVRLVLFGHTWILHRKYFDGMKAFGDIQG